MSKSKNAKKRLETLLKKVMFIEDFEHSLKAHKARLGKSYSKMMQGLEKAKRHVEIEVNKFTKK